MSYFDQELCAKLIEKVALEVFKEIPEGKPLPLSSKYLFTERSKEELEDIMINKL